MTTNGIYLSISLGLGLHARSHLREKEPRKQLVTHYTVKDWNHAAPARSPAQESTCTGPSEVWQWFRGELGESFVVRWDQNRALWHQLNSSCLEEEECSLWTQEHHPHRQTWRWKHYALGVFSAKGTGQLHRIKGTMDGAMYRQGQGIEASQGIENGPWMGIPAWHWPKTHGHGNKGVAQEEAH